MQAHPVDLVELAALGYRLEVDTARMSRLLYDKEPQELTVEECEQLAWILKKKEVRE